MKPFGKWTRLMIVCAVILLAIIPLLMNKQAAFEGADGQAEEMIAQIAPDYQPWFQNLLEPPSGEIESLLFALQAAIGSGVVFFGIGYMMGKRKQEQSS